MKDLEMFYDEVEHVKSRFIGFTTGTHRYDFGFIHTQMFDGKLLVVCLQTGSSALIDRQDIKNPEQLQKSFKIRTLDEAQEVSAFFSDMIPPSTHYVLYE